MDTCLAATGLESGSMIAVAALLLVLGTAIVWSRRGPRSAAAVGLAVLTVIGLGAVTALVPASAASAADTSCPAEILPDADVTFQSGPVTLHASYRAPAVPSAEGVSAAVIIGGTGRSIGTATPRP